MGRNRLIDRLSSQVGDKALAIGILKKHGLLAPDGKSLTQKGIARNAMTAEERAIDRASRKSGRPASDFRYNPITNIAKLDR